MDYNAIKAAVAKIIRRTDLNDDMDMFITMAEAHLNRNIDTSWQEVRTRASIDTEFFPLPCDFISMRSVHIEGSPDHIVDYVPYQSLRDFAATNRAGSPLYYSVTDKTMVVAPVPGDAVDLELVYRAKLPALSADNTTNWLSDNFPDIYIYSIAFQILVSLKDPRAEAFKLHRDGLLAELEVASVRRMRGSSPRRMRTRGVI